MMKTNEHYRCIAHSLSLLSGIARSDWKRAAQAVGLSPYYFQRVFKHHIGISPQQYTACLKLEDVKQRLSAGERILSAAWDAGLSGSGRAHDLFINLEGMTPGQFAGAQIKMDYGCVHSPFGRVFIAASARGVCFMQFVADGQDTAPLLDKLHRQWRHAVLCENQSCAEGWIERVFSDAQTPLHVRGTNFQIKVWQALLAIPAGCVVSYGGLARRLRGRSNAARAVAGAAAANPVAVLIPCHRLLSANGHLTGYAWGIDKKQALLAAEFAAYEQ